MCDALITNTGACILADFWLSAQRSLGSTERVSADRAYRRKVREIKGSLLFKVLVACRAPPSTEKKSREVLRSWPELQRNGLLFFRIRQFIAQRAPPADSNLCRNLIWCPFGLILKYGDICCPVDTPDHGGHDSRRAWATPGTA